MKGRGRSYLEHFHKSAEDHRLFESEDKLF